ncbi:helix-turn-helix domain-containing protein [Rhizobium sp. WL3]|uniref:winged helix-turn-helix transcriptional regulator n=1 Tax=Rhizobium sp. WL3 TaxID=2603277 RepID=UPI001FF0309D|nr:helix-turn-helix domain-containing protein [Rhizobium sp. WL3]
MNYSPGLAPDAPTGDPVDMIKVLEGRWKLPILLRLSRGGPMRFSDLARSIPDISKRMLSQQLKQMQIDGLVRRITADATLTRVEYQLTDWGKGLKPSLASLVEWAQKAPRHGKHAKKACHQTRLPPGDM